MKNVFQAKRQLDPSKKNIQIPFQTAPKELRKDDFVWEFPQDFVFAKFQFLEREKFFQDFPYSAIERECRFELLEPIQNQDIFNPQAMRRIFPEREFC
ncbi:hypothetical protein JWG45_01205 [Leptospira sp. 201903070]|uniref:Uncharacterized protein n=1 Tax=Leptospira ainlahdjerensis TaxID=2810033 RepID=A0ABS2U5V1_9LEPT|nr:hypothetical protein [Leptospira ainlahdjerensis]MBM9575760.1 hypothetical protein [Leptospira ainlahdjerensis]